MLKYPTDLPSCIEGGTGPNTALFLHSVGGSRYSFEETVAALPEGWRGVAWDAPGYGASPALEEMTFEGLTTAAVRLLDARHAGQAVIVGHSMGGMIAQEIVARYPDRVQGLVLFATAATFAGHDPISRAQLLAGLLAPLESGLTRREIANGVIAGMFGPKPPQEAVKRAAEIMAQVGFDTYRKAITCIFDFDRRAELGQIACPTLVLAAEHDRVAPPRTVTRMAEAIPGARYHCLAGAGHFANMEDPASFNAVIGDFLKQIESRKDADPG